MFVHLALLADVADVFNKCLKENKYPSEHYKYCITFDYELLDDNYDDDNKEVETVLQVRFLSAAIPDRYPILRLHLMGLTYVCLNDIFSKCDAGKIPV